VRLIQWQQINRRFYISTAGQKFKAHSVHRQGTKHVEPQVQRRKANTSRYEAGVLSQLFSSCCWKSGDSNWQKRCTAPSWVIVHGDSRRSFLNATPCRRSTSRRQIDALPRWIDAAKMLQAFCSHGQFLSDLGR